MRFEISRFQIAAIWGFALRLFLAKPSIFIVFVTPMDQNTIFRPRFGMLKSSPFRMLLGFCNTSQSFNIVKNGGSVGIVCNFQLRICELAESDASLAQCDSPRPATRIIAKLRILDSDAFCTTIWVKLSLGSRTASELACINAHLDNLARCR